MRLLIGYDGSKCAKDAIESLQKAGLPLDTEALVVSSAEVFAHAGPLVPASVAGVAAIQEMPLTVAEVRAQAAAALRDARHIAADGAKFVESFFSTWTVRSEAASDMAYGELVEKAEKWHADLIVTGSHGRSTLGRMILGSVSQQVLSHADCSVRIGRAAETYFAPPRLLLAIDGSSDSAAAIEAVMLRVWPAGTHVRVVTAVDLNLLSILPLIGMASALPDDESPEVMFRRRADAIVDQLREFGLLADSVVTVGDPKRVLLNEAQDWHADCIFIGAKGHGRLARALVGSVSATVAARAHCSVEVVR
jgi:nucleotide-binding universal stress UspA family protein